MSIKISKDNRLITIHTARTTYQMAVGKYGYLFHLYYGKRTEGDMRYLLTYVDRGFSPNPYEADYDKTFSLDTLPQEYPSLGTGDFRSHAVRVRNTDGTYSLDLRFQSARVLDGKYAVPELPAVYADGCGAQTLEILLADPVSGVEVTLYYGVLEDSDVITRAVCIRNGGSGVVTVEKAASLSLDFLHGAYDLIHFHGRHGMERQMQRNAVMDGRMVLESRRGASSHQQNPFFILAERGAGETAGNCYGFSLLYSGNFKVETERDQTQQTRCMVGISDECFAWELEPGEEFRTPEAAMCCSTDGLETLSHQFHDLIRCHVCRGAYRTARRPVLINNWEATYFDFTGEKIIGIAKQAAELGVEMLVLDDGWFGVRNGETSGLGDWTVNERKLGSTLAHVSSRIRELGMKFGLWIEPEMVSEDSDLYRAHPDWAFRIPGRAPVRGRYQLVLDFSRPEVVDHVFSQIASVLEAADVDYVKMDMNRHLTDIFSAGTGRQNQGAIVHRYVLGVYRFLERLTERFPKLLIEGCAGGGGRFDAGMLYYTPQIWCSDNTDAVDRIKIQYGTSFGYPISAVGSHVSAVPNHQTGRVTDIRTRAVVAMAGSFGYELDLNLITEEEKELVRSQIADYKRYWDLIQNGRYYRLTNPLEDTETAAWQFVSRDGAETLLNVVTMDTHCNAPVRYVKLRGLDADGVYEAELPDGAEAVKQPGGAGAAGQPDGAEAAELPGGADTAELPGGNAGEAQDGDSGAAGRQYCGAALMEAGIPVPQMSGQYQSWQLHLTRVGSC